MKIDENGYSQCLRSSIFIDFRYQSVNCYWLISITIDLYRLSDFIDWTGRAIYRDFTLPRLSQFKEISQCPACVNLQRFHNALLVLIYRDFMMPCLHQFTEILWCPVCVNLQRFTMPRLCQFTEISQCHACVNLQKFHNALFVSIYRDFMRQFTEISFWKFSAAFFTDILDGKVTKENYCKC